MKFKTESEIKQDFAIHNIQREKRIQDWVNNYMEKLETKITTKQLTLFNNDTHIQHQLPITKNTKQTLKEIPKQQNTS